MNESSKNLGKITNTISEHGAPVIEQLLDKLTGKGAQVKYSFDKVNIEMPSATKPDGSTVKGGRLTIHGAVTIAAKVSDLNDSKASSDLYTNSSSNISESNYGNTIENNNSNENQTISDSNLKDYNSNQNTTN